MAPAQGNGENQRPRTMATQIACGKESLAMEEVQDGRKAPEQVIEMVAGVNQLQLLITVGGIQRVPMARCREVGAPPSLRKAAVAVQAVEEVGVLDPGVVPVL